MYLFLVSFVFFDLGMSKHFPHLQT
jgi:hypothetical protein